MTDPIRDLLAEEGMSNERELEEFLLGMRADAIGSRPVPSTAVAALMPDRPVRRVPSRGRRRIVTGLIVLGSLGAGVGAAAASPEVRSATQQVVQTVIGSVGSVVAPPSSTTRPHATPMPTPSASVTTADHPSPSDHPGKGIGATEAPGKTGVLPPPSQGKATPPAHPVPAPSDPGKSHRP